MKIATCLLAIFYSALALPADVPFEVLEETDLSKVTAKKIYVEPINPVKHVDLPGSRIVGGAELAPNAAPYQAALLLNGWNLCSGSLISTTRVLTTAYCTVDVSYVEVRLGAHYFDQAETTQVRITSSSIIAHGSFDIDGRANDIAIIFLPSQAPINNFIKVVELAPTTAGTYEESWGLIAGWGTTTDATDLVAPALRGAYVSVISNEACRNIYGSAVVLDTKLCTSGAGIVGICSGDLGSPLVVAGVQIGIAAFNSRCEIGLPSGYTRISSFRTWINLYAGV